MLAYETALSLLQPHITLPLLIVQGKMSETMTVRDIYEQTIKPLARTDRTALAELIIHDLEPEPESPVRNAAHLDQLIAEGFRSGSILADDAFWNERERRARERLGPE